MTFLCLEGSTDDWSVSLMKDGQELSGLQFSQSTQMAAQLVPAIQTIMQQSAYEWGGIDAIVISSGPGSYTGLRIIASTAKGLCFATGLPMIAIPTLYSLIQPYLGNTAYDLVIPMIDARRNDVFCGVYDMKGTEIQKPALTTLNADSFASYSGRNILVCGNGVKKCSVALNDITITRGSEMCRAADLFSAAMKAFHADEFENISSFSPFYLLPPNITQSKKK